MLALGVSIPWIWWPGLHGAADSAPVDWVEAMLDVRRRSAGTTIDAPLQEQIHWSELLKRLSEKNGPYEANP